MDNKNTETKFTALEKYFYQLHKPKRKATMLEICIFAVLFVILVNILELFI